ncbi:MAG: hypothetical protein JWN32_1350, partial [Solirubrobacterales bacterium]|nr:hypothetical protein [Solirubrobacterales bacterium]
MKDSRLKRPAIVGAVCAALAAGGIVATAAARSGHSTRSAHSTSTTAATAPHDGPHGGFAVHAEEVVLNKAGTAFITQTEDSGTVSSVSGDQLAIKEGTKTVTYKTVTLTIPSGAGVYRNGAKATLPDLKTGDQVRVTQSSDGTTVFAGDKAFGPGREHGPGHRGGPPPAGAPGYGG